MQSEPVNILTIQFANEISQHEIPLFRGAINHSLENKSILFHNHDGDKLRYSYPLIQYKKIKENAAIICIGKGTESIHDLFQLGNIQLHLGKKEIEMHIKSVHVEPVHIGYHENENHYKLHNWLPLNSDNYEVYQGKEDMVSKIQLLERILVGNILSLFKGIGIHADQQISLHITDITAQQMVYYKRVKLMSFDIEFKANVSLPQYIGIGKNASIGYGMLTKNTR